MGYQLIIPVQDDGTPARVVKFSTLEVVATASFFVGSMALSTVGGVLSAYHGYKRSGGSLVQGFAWGVVGTWVPLISVPLAIIEGFGKEKKKKRKSRG